MIYYKCTEIKGCTCKKKYVRQEKIEALYQDVFDKIQLPPEIAEEMFIEIKKVYKEFSVNDNSSIEALSKEQPKIEAKIEKLYEDKLDEIIDAGFLRKNK